MPPWLARAPTLPLLLILSRGPDSPVKLNGPVRYSLHMTPDPRPFQSTFPVPYAAFSKFLRGGGAASGFSVALPPRGARKATPKRATSHSFDTATSVATSTSTTLPRTAPRSFPHQSVPARRFA